jgi:outer membrane lipoprotein SlyB
VPDLSLAPTPSDSAALGDVPLDSQVALAGGLADTSLDLSLPIEAPPDAPQRRSAAAVPDASAPAPLTQETSRPLRRTVEAPAPVTSRQAPQQQPAPAVPQPAANNPAPTTTAPTATAPAPTPSTPAPPPAVPAPVARMTAGTTLAMRSADQICTDNTREGARLRAVVDQDVTGTNGARIPRGSQVTLVVSQLKRAASANDRTVFALAAESIEIGGVSYPLTASVDTFAIKPKTRGLLGAVVGAAVGAAAARAAGADTKEAIAGAAVGAAGGALVGRQMLAGDGCVERNATVRATLRADLTLR